MAGYFAKLGLALACALPSVPALAASSDAAQALAENPAPYRTIYDKFATGAWTDAKGAILAVDAADPMRPYLLAELYLAKGSPRVELFDLLDLLAKAPNLPQSERIASLAAKRGATMLPDRPQIRQLMYTGGGPQRAILAPLKGDPVADQLSPKIAAFIKADTPSAGEMLLDSSGGALSPACRTELRQRLAWSYYITNDLPNARRLATLAVTEGDSPYVAPAYWVAGLAAWREKNYAAAAMAFANVAARSADSDLRGAGYYWAARAYMADRQPQQVSALLRAAAREEESFYGMLAAETLGLPVQRGNAAVRMSEADRKRVGNLPNVRIAATLAAMGRSADADEVLRYQAGLSGSDHFDALLHVASDLSLPRTQLWLAQRSPTGAKAQAAMRYPRPDWTPAGGWRVDQSLVFAHTLQESRFQTNAISSAGARGLMQVLPGTASDLAAANGEQVTIADLNNPAVNMEYGQRYLEKLSRMGATDGLLAKVVAAYNAGPGAVDRWKYQVRDEGDPLLFIESVPFYETRAYVNVVLRNYWMYQMKDKGESAALTSLAQGLWSRFPGKGQEVAVRMSPAGRAYGAD